MCRLFRRFRPRIERGCIVSSRSGLGIVVRRHGHRVILVRIMQRSLPRHRADIHPSWAETVQTGLMWGSAIRCVPRIMDASRLHGILAPAPATLMQRIDRAITHELTVRQDEDSCRHHAGGPSIPRSLYG